MMRDLVERAVARLDVPAAERERLIDALAQAVSDAADQIVQELLRLQAPADTGPPRYARRARGATRKAEALQPQDETEP